MDKNLEHRVSARIYCKWINEAFEMYFSVIVLIARQFTRKYSTTANGNKKTLNFSSNENSWKNHINPRVSILRYLPSHIKLLIYTVVNWIRAVEAVCSVNLKCQITGAPIPSGAIYSLKHGDLGNEIWSLSTDIINRKSNNFADVFKIWSYQWGGGTGGRKMEFRDYAQKAGIFLEKIWKRK